MKGEREEAKLTEPSGRKKPQPKKVKGKKQPVVEDEEEELMHSEDDIDDELPLKPG